MNVALRISRSSFLLLCALGLALAGQQTAQGADPAKKRLDSAPAKSGDAKAKAAPQPAPATKTLRETAQEIALRHGVRIVIDDAVSADVRAPAVSDGILKGALLEATLRALFAGNELMFHYGPDASGGAERLKALWVFARAQGPALYATAASTSSNAIAALQSTDSEERVAALHRLSSEPPDHAKPVLSRALVDSDDNVRLQALHAELANASAPDVDVLKRLVEDDPSEAIRILALEAYVAHPRANDEEVRAMLDRLADDSQRMLAEFANSLRESRTAESSKPSPALTPIDEQ